MQRNILSKEKRKKSEVELMPSNPHPICGLVVRRALSLFWRTNCVQLAEKHLFPEIRTRGIHAHQGRTQAPGETLQDMRKADLL